MATPLQRSLGVSGVLRFLLAIAGVVALSAAFNAGRVGLGIAGVLFIVVAVILAAHAAQARRNAGPNPPPDGR